MPSANNFRTIKVIPVGVAFLFVLIQAWDLIIHAGILYLGK
jgi:hypothetical protein